MDLTFDEAQQAISDLADRILADHCPPEELRRAERGETSRWSRTAWAALGEAGLLGLGIPEADGGGGLGFCETALVVQAVARSAAPLPAFATLVLGAAPVAGFGTDQQRARWLPGVIDGTTVLTGVLTGADDTPGAPVHEIESAGVRRVSGTGWYVPFAGDADGFVVPVTMLSGTVVLAVVDAHAAGITVDELAPMSGEPSGIVRFEQTPLPDDALMTGSVDAPVDGYRWLVDRAVAASCVAQTGICEGALALTASYVSTREQFGSKLATFQAVAQRAADAWIDTELVRLTAWAATWRLANGLTADEELSVAKLFAAEAAQRVVAAAQHLHGGIGMDLDYPVHRYFRWAKEYELRLGGGTEHLARLGDLIARAET